MKIFIALIKLTLACIFAVFLAACSETPSIQPKTESRTEPVPMIPADSFAHPIGKTDRVTKAKDKDEWYAAQDFGENDHLGEDWNKNTGGDTDCGEPV